MVACNSCGFALDCSLTFANCRVVRASCLVASFRSVMLIYFWQGVSGSLYVLFFILVNILGNHFYFMSLFTILETITRIPVNLGERA